jgi:cellulose synthase (UDP-forming)
VPFLLAPLVYFFTGVAPLAAYDVDFYARAVPFLALNRLALLVGTWGVSSTRGEQYYLAFFWVNLRALADVLQGRPVRFHVTPKTRESRRFLGLAAPHLALIALTVAAAVVGGLRVARGDADASAYVVNVFWCALNVWSLSPLLVAALRKREDAA